MFVRGFVEDPLGEGERTEGHVIPGGVQRKVTLVKLIKLINISIFCKLLFVQYLIYICFIIGCHDSRKYRKRCRGWKRRNLCKKNRFVKRVCKKTCGCGKTTS